MNSTKRCCGVIAALTVLLLICSCTGRNESEKLETNKPFVFSGKPTSGIMFLSTQLNPVEEAGKMRNVILKDFPGRVDFRPNDNSYIFSQIGSLHRTNPAEPILIGATHGDLTWLYGKGSLQTMDRIFAGLEKREFPENLVKLARINGRELSYVPWMQASFVMAANRKALPYLPAGADLNALTYGELYQWTRNIYEKTGMKPLGFPAGKNGLMHRFFQGYLYPSFTASTLLKFRGSDARAMWDYFRGLWAFVHSDSLVYSTMAEPLLTGDVWIAWDHTARLRKAFEERPADFIAFPAPIGTKGRGFMPVISGLAVPRGTMDTGNLALLIDYLTQPEIQARTLRETGFFPVVNGGADSGIPPYLKELSSAVERQANSLRSIPTLIPVGLGERTGDYNSLFMVTFSEIVLDGRDIRTVLNANAAELQAIINQENARCWLPDISDERPCRIE